MRIRKRTFAGRGLLVLATGTLLAGFIGAPDAQASYNIGWYGAGGQCNNPGGHWLAATSYLVLAQSCHDDTGYSRQAQTRVISQSSQSWAILASSQWVNETAMTSSAQTTLSPGGERNYFGLQIWEPSCAPYHDIVSRVVANSIADPVDSTWFQVC